MSVNTEEYVKSILEKVASICDLKQWQYETTQLNEMGQNYFGLIIPVTLSGKCKHQNLTLSLIAKLAPMDERFRISGAMTLMFNREVYVYSVIFKKMLQIQQEFPLHHRLIVPKCYYSCNDYCKEALILQNMCSEGYKPYISDMFLNVDHIIISLQSIAKLHALSFILKNSDVTLYNKIANECKPLSEKTNSRFIEILKDRLTKVIDLFENNEMGSLLQRMKRECARLTEIVGEAGVVRETVICHGDIWKENIIFKYDNNKPTSACLLDYQTARLSSPAFDFLYLITVSCDSASRQEHMQTFMEAYYSTLSDVLHVANLSAKIIYSLDDFKSDLKTVAPACLIVGNTALWLFSGLVTEGHVKSKNPCITKEERLKALNSHKTLIKNIIDDFRKYGYL